MSVGIEVRVDKWLWAARFYKMRSLATEACKGGHVLINGMRAKASRLVHINDEIQLQKETESFTVIITGLAGKRGSAKIAQGLYSETPESLKFRAECSEQKKFQTYFAPSPDKRPDKRDRRKIKAFKGRM
ncbi:MAG TPA: RNA-binding protein [Ghiorsea sp.]|nr:RNA-binding protein [Ghiorsea sp.]HIP08051.1 RNA-binding protein [Mariprofundaceae bacterium]